MLNYIPTEPVGSVPRPVELIAVINALAKKENLSGLIEAVNLQEASLHLAKLFDDAVIDTLIQFEKTGSPIIADGEQTKSSFISYPLDGLDNIVPGGVKIEFADGHYRQLPLLVSGPFKFGTYAVDYLKFALSHTKLPVKQAVISASALSLIYPETPLESYSKEQFIDDLINECEKDIRLCLEAGAANVQIDFTEGRLALKLDPTGQLLKQFIDLNNKVLNRFTAEEQEKLGVHVCSGGDCDSTHCADVDYNEFLPFLFELNLKNFFLQLAGEPDRIRVLKTIRQYLKPNQLAFIGVINSIDPEIETAEIVRDRILEAAEYIPLEQLGTTDDCGFSPFSNDSSTSRELAFKKIKARIDGTKLAERILFS